MRVVTGTHTQVREINGGEGYHGQNSLRAEFGLGLSAVIDSVTVRWPSGVVQQLGSVTASQLLEVVEPGPDAPVMDAEPAYTSGTTNTVSWSDESGSGAVEYRVQAALDTGFATLVGDSGWIVGPLARVHRPVRRPARPLPGPRPRRGRHRLALVGLGGLAPG